MKKTKNRIISVFITFSMLLAMIQTTTIQVSANRSGDWDWQPIPIDGITVARIIAYHGSGGVVTMPSTLDGFSVREFTQAVFRGNTTISRVTIPNTITSIPNQAFQNCTGLTAATFPNTLTSIGSSAFQNTAITTITVPNSVTSIGASAFSGNAQLSSATLGTGITSIADYLFNGCTRLSSITIPARVTSVGDGSFQGCTSLATVRFTSVRPPTVNTSSTWGSFRNTNNIVTIEIPTGTREYYLRTNLTGQANYTATLREISITAYPPC
jgi:hypothetical protein